MVPKELKDYKYSKNGIHWINPILIFYIVLDTLWGINVVKANAPDVNALFVFSTMGIGCVYISGLLVEPLNYAQMLMQT